MASIYLHAQCSPQPVDLFARSDFQISRSQIVVRTYLARKKIMCSTTTD